MQNTEQQNMVESADAAFKALNAAIDDMGRAGVFVPLAAFIVSAKGEELSANFNTPMGFGIKRVLQAIEDKTFETDEGLVAYAETAVLPVCWLFNQALQNLADYYDGLVQTLAGALPKTEDDAVSETGAGQGADGVETLPEAEATEVPA